MRIQITKLRCLRCGHKWVPTKTVIKMCPECKSKLWHTKRTNNQGRRMGGKK